MRRYRLRVDPGNLRTDLAAGRPTLVGGYLGGMSSFSATLGLCVYLAWGLATSPLPLAGLAVILLSGRAGRAATAFTATWFGCQLVAISVFSFLAHYLVNLRETSHEKEILGICLLVLGSAMMLSGAIVWWRQRNHPNPKNGQQTRAFLARAERAGPAEAWKLAIVTALLNITNVPYWAGIGLLIERSRLSVADKVSIIFVTSVVASVTFIFVTILVLASRGRLDRLLGRGRDFVLKHSGSVVPGFLAGCGVGAALVGASDLGLL